MLYVHSPNPTSFTVEGLFHRKYPPLEAVVLYQRFPLKLSSVQALHRSTKSLLCCVPLKLSPIQALHRSTEGILCRASHSSPSNLFTTPSKVSFALLHRSRPSSSPLHRSSPLLCSTKAVQPLHRSAGV
uniref:Uncharacterized protein n=1 Tax=Nelumbo nucifera TaxID=4432 RepID=A0A822Z3T5_NELNU|nr:TPA_asm: hypothetical protein HUJ06_013623 [Nelumbo nucifera]